MSKPGQLTLDPPATKRLPQHAQEVMKTLCSRVFRPRRWLKNRHVMTMAGHFISREFPGLPEIDHPRLFQVTPDAQMLTHCGWQPDKTSAPTVLVVHGLEGSSASKYATGTAMKAYRAGFNVIRINQRGCNDTFHLSPSPYHAGLTNDLRAIIDELVLNDGITKIYIVGFSLGGNQSLKLAGEYGDAPPAVIGGVCAVSVPLDLGIVADSLNWVQNWTYQYNFLLSLYNSYQRRQALHPDRYNLPKFSKVLTMRKFDDLIAGPCNGFRDAEDYYQQCSSQSFVSRIHIPTLIIQAKDDPFIPFEPFQRAKMSEFVALLATNEGGHVGYVGAPIEGEDEYWCENRAVEYFRLLQGK